MILVFLASIAMAAPDRSQPPVYRGDVVVHEPLPTTHHLEDNTPVWLIERSNVPLVRVQLTIRGGFLSDSDPQAAMLAGALVGRATQRRSAQQLERKLTSFGGLLSVGVDAHSVWASIEFLSGREREAVLILEEALKYPSFRRARLRRVRTRWANRLKDAWRLIGRVHNRALSEALYSSDHPLAFYPTPKDFRRVNLRRVKAAWNRLLQSGTTTVLVAGDTTPQRVLPQLDRALTDLGGSMMAREIPPPIFHDRQVILVDHPGASQFIITHTRPAVAIDAQNRDAVALSNRVFGGDFTSRLNQVLREEKGLVYNVYSDLDVRTGWGRLEVTCRGENQDVVEVLDSLENEISQMVSDPPDEAELRRASRSMKIQRARELEKLSTLTFSLGVYQSLGLPINSVHSHLEAVDSIGVQEVAVASEILFGGSDELWVITGDRQTLELALEEGHWFPDSIRSGADLLR